MPEDDQTQEGIVTPSEPPKPTAKMVPEKDLLAYKSSAEREKKELQAKLEQTTEAHQQAHSNYLQAQAAKEQLEEQLKEGTATKDEVAQLQSELENKKTQVVNLEQRLTDQKVEFIHNTFGTPLDTLKGKTVEQLELVLETLQAAGVRKPPPLDTGGGDVRGAVPSTPIDQCREEIAALRGNK